MATKLKRGAGYGVVMMTKKREIYNCTLSSSGINSFNLLGITLFIKADCAAVFISSHSILCKCRVLCVIGVVKKWHYSTAVIRLAYLFKPELIDLRK